MRRALWRKAMCSFPLASQGILRRIVLVIAILFLFDDSLTCNAFRWSISAGIPYTHLCSSTVLSKEWLPMRWEGLRSCSSLQAVSEGIFSTQGKVVRSSLLSDLVERGIISQSTDLQGFDEFLCSYELGEVTSDGRKPAIYYGIDLTNNFIHEGTLFQLQVLRRFLEHKFNVVIILGGGTTTVGDPSYKSRCAKTLACSPADGSRADSVVLNQEYVFPLPSHENSCAILDIVSKVLTQDISVPGGVVKPSLYLASNMSDSEVDKITSSCYNVVCLNNRELYDSITLSEYLSTVASKMSVGRMLSRECIKSRLSLGEEDGSTKLQVKMNLAEFMYMSLQATDFVHVASKFNTIIQLGGSDQMGNIMSGVELFRSLRGDDMRIFGITTPLLQTPSGEKISKSVGNCLLKITANTRALPFWSHFRSVDDSVVEPYLRWLTRVPLSLIQDTLGKHVNDAKILLADELTSAVFGRGYTDALHKYWVSRDTRCLTEPRKGLSKADYESFVKFTECVTNVTVDSVELDKGIDFGSLLDQLRTSQTVSGRFYSNRRAIREGTCHINGSVVTSVHHKVTVDDLIRVSCDDGRVLQYISIQYGKHQLYFVKLQLN